MAEERTASGDRGCFFSLFFDKAPLIFLKETGENAILIAENKGCRTLHRREKRMKYNMMFQMLGKTLDSITKEKLTDKTQRKEIRNTYREIVERAKDIGSKNKLISSYGLAAYFIAMNRKGSLTPEENFRILDDGMRKSRLLKTFMGDAKHYFSEKNMESRRKWSAETHKRKYENDWVVDVLEKSGDYEFGLDYTECGVCKLCRQEGCPELAEYLCRLDFMLVEIMGIGLKRTMTLAEGAEKCDFRFLKQ